MSSMGGGLLAGQGGRPCVGICYLRSLQTLKTGKMFSGRRWTCLHWTLSGTNPVWASAICRESGGWVLNKNVWVFNILICILKSRERQRSRYSRSRRREVRRRPVLDFAISPRFPDVDISNYLTWCIYLIISPIFFGRCDGQETEWCSKMFLSDIELWSMMFNGAQWCSTMFSFGRTRLWKRPHSKRQTRPPDLRKTLSLPRVKQNKYFLLKVRSFWTGVASRSHSSY